MKVLRTISALILALLVLVSSTSFMVGVHICMDEVKNVALFSKADGCEKEQALPPCHRHSTAPCCDDETVINQADDFKAPIGFHALSVPTPIHIEQPLIPISEIIPTTPLSLFRYHTYDPPLQSRDLTVDHQVFLI